MDNLEIAGVVVAAAAVTVLTVAAVRRYRRNRKTKQESETTARAVAWHNRQEYEAQQDVWWDDSRHHRPYHPTNASNVSNYQPRYNSDDVSQYNSSGTSSSLLDSALTSILVLDALSRSNSTPAVEPPASRDTDSDSSSSTSSSWFSSSSSSDSSSSSWDSDSSSSSSSDSSWD